MICRQQTDVTNQTQLPELLDGLPNIAGWEALVRATTQSTVDLPEPRKRSAGEHHCGLRGRFAYAPATIPAGADGALISNLQYMFDHPNEGDNHNSGAFAECYRRMGDIIPEQVAAVGGAADGARGHSGQSQADHL
jgi:hypothetical protein